MGKFTQHMGKFTQTSHVSCNDMGKFTQHVGKFAQLLHTFCAMIVQTLKCSNKSLICIHIMHQLWLKQEPWTFFLVKLLISLRCFLENLHHWQEFYTTAGRTGRAKYQLWTVRWIFVDISLWSWSWLLIFKECVLERMLYHGVKFQCQ